MRTLLLSLVVGFLLAGCTPTDQLVGSFSYTMTGTDNTTSPTSSTSTASGQGTIAVTHGVATDYVVVVAQTDSSACVLKGSKTKDKPTVITITSGQTCTINAGSGSATATMTGGSLTLDAATENVQTLQVTYSYTGSLLGISYAGTGSRTYTGPRF